MTTKGQASIVAKSERLENGKYRGVVVQRLLGHFAIDEFEIHCTYERDTEEEAVRDAEALAERRRRSLYYRGYFPVP